MKFLIINNISTNKTLANKWFAFSKLEDNNFGASLKDLGKEWFAVSKMDITVVNIIEKLK